MKKCPVNLIQEYLDDYMKYRGKEFKYDMFADYVNSRDSTAVTFQRIAPAEDPDVFISKRTGNKTKKVEVKQCLYLVEEKKKRL